jgi:hypothetical protein
MKRFFKKTGTDPAGNIPPEKPKSKRRAIWFFIAGGLLLIMGVAVAFLGGFGKDPGTDQTVAQSRDNFADSGGGHAPTNLVAATSHDAPGEPDAHGSAPATDHAAAGSHQATEPAHGPAIQGGSHAADVSGTHGGQAATSPPQDIHGKSDNIVHTTPGHDPHAVSTQDTHTATPHGAPVVSTHETPAAPAAHGTQDTASHGAPAAPLQDTHAAPAVDTHGAPVQDTHGAPSTHGDEAASHEEGAHGDTQGGDHMKTWDYPAKGMALVAATIEPLQYELEDRFWGWRPNDLIIFTDNVINFQSGVLEVIRRTAVHLAERISRTGSTDLFDRNLENAMNWFMIKKERFWFPSAESKYRLGISELEKYMKKLAKGEAKFFNRADNLIPLLLAYEDLLGGCDENLAKHIEEDGTHVSFFNADDYFYYAKGVASATHNILMGINQDFKEIIESRGGMGTLHHAIESCHHAMGVDPLIILESDLGSLFANHRANMAAAISHAKFYISVLIKTLST